MKHWLYKYGHHILAHAHEIMIPIVLEIGRINMALFLLLLGVLALITGLQLLLGASEA